MKRIQFYTGFERFWHWFQAALVILLALTGFDIHFHWGIWEFKDALFWHHTFAWMFIILIAFAIFWHFTTGAWKQYVPGRGNVIAQAMYYMFGIFRHEPHPVEKTPQLKLNPLQRIAYAVLKILVIPVQVTTGFLLYYHNDLGAINLENLPFGPVALIHTIGAFALIGGMFAHIYLATTGRTPLANIKAMITGWEELEEEPHAS